MSLIKGRVKCLHVLQMNTKYRSKGEVCGYTFLPRTDVPKLCPRCRARLHKFKIVPVKGGTEQ